MPKKSSESGRSSSSASPANIRTWWSQGWASAQWPGWSSKS
jgi:hypothetical protein